MTESPKLEDLDPVETREWLESIDSVLRAHGPERAHFLLEPWRRSQATAVSRISAIASEPRPDEKPRSPQNATMCTNGTAMAVQQQKPAADSSTMSDGRRHRQDRQIFRRARRLARAIGDGRT